MNALVTHYLSNRKIKTLIFLLIRAEAQNLDILKLNQQKETGLHLIPDLCLHFVTLILGHQQPRNTIINELISKLLIFIRHMP